MLSEKTKTHILDLQAAYPEKRSALIPALHLAQAEVGYLPIDVQREVADLFDIDLSEVHAVVTFYDMFFEEPVGRCLLHICKNVSCMLRGGDALLESVCRKLQVRPGETTADGDFTVVPSECLAACDRAPVVIIGEKVEGPIQEGDLDRLLAEARQRLASHTLVEPTEEGHV